MIQPHTLPVHCFKTIFSLFVAAHLKFKSYWLIINIL